MWYESRVADKISYAGYEAEAMFRRLVPFSIDTTSPSKGDVRVILGGVEHYVEVKSCRSVKGGIANQVRAIKYLTIAIHTPARKTAWIVFPANVVLKYVMQKARGQHSEVPFENATVSLGEWADEFACTSEELPRRVMGAIFEAGRYPDLKRSMDLLMYDLKRLSYRARDEVEQILGGERPPYWVGDDNGT